ncbi:MAG: DNA cytosine methyltransferase [Candidatus Viridilinea halotolerans]|uniref:DNA (cytosine-5-)-methyltransferase n=1 Tax=Candidatus Viridilinea halotolerans TaxID=2491704 RepID=A0A426U5Z6_9CHLR|nr:MAG: DNA cytosine methyltransferase [Candidatus Viridilinea halotolerans]
MHVIELFAGAAGLAQGFERAGDYETIAYYDNFAPAQSTFLANRPGAAYFKQDVSELQAHAVQETLAGRTLHGILGGPPCQGFSLAGKKQPQNVINQLVLAYARVVTQIQPFFLMMENVPQLLFHPLFQPLMDQIEQHYLVTYGILNAARYGTPQTRHRLILIAYRRDLNLQPTLPVPTHGKYGQSLYSYYLPSSDDRVKLTKKSAPHIFGADPIIKARIARQLDQVSTEISACLKPLVTVQNAIGDVIGVTENSNATVPYTKQATNDYQRRLRSTCGEVANCTSRQHQPDMLHMMQSVREGGILDADTSGSRNAVHYSQAYGRLHRRGLARTLTTYFQNAGSGRFFHYQESRTLTIREGARIQGFSDDFVFHGNLADQMLLVGNAVPLPLAEAIGQHIKQQIQHILPT